MDCDGCARRGVGACIRPVAAGTCGASVAVGPALYGTERGAWTGACRAHPRVCTTGVLVAGSFPCLCGMACHAALYDGRTQKHAGVGTLSDPDTGNFWRMVSGGLGTGHGGIWGPTGFAAAAESRGGCDHGVAGHPCGRFSTDRRPRGYSRFRDR